METKNTEENNNHSNPNQKIGVTDNISTLKTLENTKNKLSMGLSNSFETLKQKVDDKTIEDTANKIGGGLLNSWNKVVDNVQPTKTSNVEQLQPNNQQTSINQAKTSNLEVGNQQQVQHSKSDNVQTSNQQQTSINQNKTSNLEVGNQQQVQQSKGDGDFGFEKGLKGLKETTEIWKPNENKIVQPVEQVNDKK